MDFLFSLLTFVLVVAILGLIVFVHEFGHFIVAKLSGVKVEEFAFGFGKRLLQKEWRGTVYKVNLLPFGGYVKLQGEIYSAEDKRPDSFSSQSLAKKVAVLLAGIVMNFILAVVLFSIYLASVNYQVSFRAIEDYPFLGTKSVTLMLPIFGVEDGSPASKALKEGDIITGINGQKFVSVSAFTDTLQANAGNTITIDYSTNTVDPNLDTQSAQITLRRSDEQKPLLGVSYAKFYFISYFDNFLAGVPHAVNMLGYQVQSLANLIGQSIQKSDAKIALREVGGVIAVGNLVSTVISVGDFGSLINLTALLSIAVAFFNVLPLPLLDGGHVLIESIQAWRKRRIPERYINVINNVGFIFLVLLSIGITFKDAVQFNFLTNIWDGIRAIIGR